ncbi:MAG: PQQ-binding-like beta-propeller repeat protein, partial [Thermotogae bacterium]|nr:PQQ-binding-like beta-propeller repeat protein [Thermotogota bacterium]
GKIYSSPVIDSNETIYIGAGDNCLYAIDSNGTLKWKYKTKGDIRSSPAIGSDGTIYVGSDDNYLYAIDPNGTLKWKCETNGDVRSSPTIGPDGTIYVGSDDNYLYAIIYGNNDGLSNTPWPMFHHDIRHQGISKKRNLIGTVNVGYLHVRNGPGVDFEIVATLSKKTIVVILKKEKGWYKVRVKNTTGWVFGKYIEIRR